MSEEEEQTDSETEETQQNSSSEELGEEGKSRIKNKHDDVSEYEKQRLRRIKENSDRMAALGLRNMASKLTIPVQEQQGRKKVKGKEKLVHEDEEYTPCDDDGDDCDDDDDDDDDDEHLSSESDDDDNDEDFVGVKGSRSRKVQKSKNSKFKKKVTLQELLGSTDVIDEDAELMQAIALSLKDSELSNYADCGPSQIDSNKMIDIPIKGNCHVEKDTGKRKRKQPQVRSRVQMTEDEVIMHFFQFDEAGKGGINLRDLWRMANTHDFTWTDDEMDDMITCFDKDGDGKLSLDDFRGIVSRCNMIANPLPVGKS